MRSSRSARPTGRPRTWSWSTRRGSTRRRCRWHWPSSRSGRRLSRCSWRPFLSLGTRRLLREHGACWADAAGNFRVVLEKPAVFVEIEGAAKNPFGRGDVPLKSLKGPSAAAVVRALCDYRPPYSLGRARKGDRTGDGQHLQGGRPSDSRSAGGEGEPAGSASSPSIGRASSGGGARTTRCSARIERSPS